MPVRSNPPLIFAATSAVMSHFAAAKSEWSKRLLQRGAPATGGAIPGAIAAGAVRRLSGTVSPRPEHNVVGVGIGEKVVDGRPTGEAAVKFFVRVKYPPGQIEPNAMLPKSVGGLPTDVEETGVFRRLLPAAAGAARRGAGAGRRAARSRTGGRAAAIARAQARVHAQPSDANSPGATRLLGRLPLPWRRLRHGGDLWRPRAQGDRSIHPEQ